MYILNFMYIEYIYIYIYIYIQMPSAIPATALRPVDFPHRNVDRKTECSPIFQQFLKGFCGGLGLHFYRFGSRFWSYFGDFEIPFWWLWAPRGVLFEVRASIWSPMAPRCEKERFFGEVPPRLGSSFGILFVVFCVFLSFFVHFIMSPVFDRFRGRFREHF